MTKTALDKYGLVHPIFQWQHKNMKSPCASTVNQLRLDRIYCRGTLPAVTLPDIYVSAGYSR
jgi:hypothetical protein